MRKVYLSGEGEILRFEVKRPGLDAPLKFDIEPKREDGSNNPTIGVFRYNSLTFLDPPLIPPAGLLTPFQGGNAGLKPEDVVEAAGPAGEEPTPLRDILDWNRVVSRYRDKTLHVVVSSTPKDGTTPTEGAGRRTVELPANQFVDFGFRLDAEPIAAIRGGSPAEKAGLRKGDRILKVDGDPAFDALRLPTLMHERSGSTIAIEVERPEPGAKPRLVSFQVTPDATLPWLELTTPSAPLEVAGLGLAYHLQPKIVEVRPGSPAAKAGLKAGDVLSTMTLPSHQIGKVKTKPIPLEIGPDKTSWASAWQQVQLVPLAPVVLTVNNAKAPISITPEPVAGWFNPQRGEQFQFLLQKMPPLGAQAALQKGMDDTIDNILSIYAMFRSFYQSRMSPKSLGGPIMIAQVAYSAAGSSLTDLIHFLGVLSINLAVLNFLPIPPLDGGQMLFLIGEKIRGRPLPESAVIGGTYLGLLLVLCLMVFVIFQDVSRLVGNF
jgi:regulator of sigma E protease